MYFSDNSPKDFCSNDYAKEMGIYVLYGVLDSPVDYFYPTLDFSILFPIIVSFFSESNLMS